MISVLGLRSKHVNERSHVRAISERVETIFVVRIKFGLAVG